jgi:hypothetical protein
MTTRLELRARVRAELNDAGGTPLWSDAALNQWLDEAIREYGEHLPREASVNLTSVAGQAEYALPVDLDRVLRVEHPDGAFRVAARSAGGDVTAVDAIDRSFLTGAYDAWGGQLELHPAPDASGEAIRVRYLAAYAAPTSDGATLTTPMRDDAVLMWSVCSRALRWIDTDESKRQRFERERGASAHQAANEYQREVRAAYARRLQRARSARLAIRSE